MEPEAPNIQARTLGDTLQKLRKETSKMVWQVNVLPTKPQDLDSVLGTHLLEGENCLQPGVLFLPRAHCGTCVCACVHPLVHVHILTDKVTMDEMSGERKSVEEAVCVRK